MKRLEENEYSVEKDVSYNGCNFSIVAKYRFYKPLMLGGIDTACLISIRKTIDFADFLSHTHLCAEYINQTSRYACVVPVVIAEELDPITLISIATMEPVCYPSFKKSMMKQRVAVATPVIYDLRSKRCLYIQRMPLTCQVYWYMAKKLVQKILMAESDLNS